jgi:hypothetical protein
MPRLFPQFFNPSDLDGPRAKHFQSPHDAFQQLIGDALKETTGHRAYVSPTKGRDGSIDAFIEDGAVLPTPFQQLPLPLVLETKYHDEKVKDLRKNILTGWENVRSTLEQAAQNGWTGLFQPWRHAHGYAYCVSAFLRNKDTRDELTEAIQNFFAELPATQRPPIEHVRVVDWNDLRDWLSTLRRLSDSWLGIELDLIVAHEAYIKELGGFRKYLLPSNLQFVLPDDRKPFHPDRLMEQLEESDEKAGVLLVGAGGVGKTRTCLEVATRAVQRGWRVLHILPGEPGIDNQRLAEEILRSRDKTLLVFDYIDQMHKLDLSTLRRTLIPQPDAPGIRLRVLANSRPGWASSSNPGRDELFSTTEVHLTDSQKSEITQAMVNRIAPNACKLLGVREITRLCGHRAIIALLIARELEALAETGNLRKINIESLRPGDLVVWLKRRLEESGLSLKTKPTSLVPPQPANQMIAAAAALVCAPATKEKLILASQCVFDFLGCERSSEYSRSVVKALINHGWLEPQESNYSAAHDVVADEVFDKTIRFEEIVFEKEFNAILACTLEVPQAIGPLARSLGRLIGAIKDCEAVRSVEDFANQWLSFHAVSLGTVLSKGSPDLTGYAIGAVLSGPPWDVAALEHWDDLVSPWLSAHASTEDARHVLFRGLHNTKPHQARLVIESALHWLETYSTRFGSGYVITGLLERDDLAAGEAESAIQFALDWLDEQRKTLETRFVLTALLARPDLVAHQSEKARQHGVLWLVENKSSLEAQFVVRALLLRPDLSVAESQQASQLAHHWLEEYGNLLEAEYVLNALLARNDLLADELEKPIAFAFQWLDKYSDKPEIRWVLQPLLRQDDLSPEEAEKARRIALQWLHENYPKLEAQFVLSAFLDRRDFKDREAAEIRKLAVQWLGAYHLSCEAQFVLRALLEPAELAGEHSEKGREFATAWLEQYLEYFEAHHVFKVVLARKDLSKDQSTKARSRAARWLVAHLDKLEAQFVLRRLLERPDLTSEQSREAREFAFKWLGCHSRTPEARFVLNPLLLRSDMTSYQSGISRQISFKWLDAYGRTQEADFVLSALLDNPELTPHDVDEVVGRAVEWLEEFPDTIAGEYLLKRLSRRQCGMSISTNERLVSFGIRRLHNVLEEDEATRLLRHCFEFKIRDGQVKRELISLAIKWLELHPESPHGDYVWNRILRDRVVSDADWQRACEHALHWLKGKTIYAHQIDYAINSILSRPHLIPKKELEPFSSFAIELLTVIQGEDRKRLIQNVHRLLRTVPLGDPVREKLQLLSSYR